MVAIIIMIIIPIFLTDYYLLHENGGILYSDMHLEVLAVLDSFKLSINEITKETTVSAANLCFYRKSYNPL